MDNNATPVQHKRRIRYSGTHPNRYEEKYKEANPDKYVETIEKVISKGNTPAGMHISICVKEIFRENRWAFCVLNHIEIFHPVLLLWHTSISSESSLCYFCVK